MLFRINYDNFIIHAIDHFSLEEITSMQYMIVSANIKNTDLSPNVSKPSVLYPPMDIQNLYMDTMDADRIRKPYLKFLKDDELANHTLYTNILEPTLNHMNVIIITSMIEDPYVDVLCEYIRIAYKIDTIDLNQLFETGTVNTISMNMRDVRDSAVGIRRRVTKMKLDSLEQTADGRSRILRNMMNKKEKIRKIKKLGYTVSNSDMNRLDEILSDIWVEDGD